MQVRLAFKAQSHEVHVLMWSPMDGGKIAQITLRKYAQADTC